jgi:hypothetical protein
MIRWRRVPGQRAWRAARTAMAAVSFVSAAAVAFGACKPRERDADDLALRFWTDSFQLSVSADPVPPYAREATLYKVVVRDKESRRFIENGEGRIFATSADSVNIFDGLVPGPELGTYYAKLSYVTAGDWAVAVQFRRDSTQRLERADWTQSVRNARD